MARDVMQKQWLALVLAGGILAWFAGCGSGSSGTNTGSQSRPGACVCFDGSLNFRSCVVTADLQTCRRTVTTCNPFFYTNSDCSHWCPSTPQACS